MKTYATIFVVGLALLHSTVAYAGTNTGLKSNSTLPSAQPVEIGINLTKPVKKGADQTGQCYYKTWELCVAACGKNLCRRCSGTGKYECIKMK